MDLTEPIDFFPNEGHDIPRAFSIVEKIENLILLRQSGWFGYIE